MVRRATLTHEEYLATARFERLDGVRALSVLLVFSAHPANEAMWSRFHGAAGVSIFFVLSGYLITTLLAREFSARGRIDLRAFYVRRLFRIYPTYFLMMAAYCLLILVLGLQPERRTAFVHNIPYFILFLPEHAFFGDNGGVHVPFDGAWSIGIEEKFYLVWPVVGFVVLGLLARARLAVTLLTVASLAALSLVFAEGRWVAPYALIAVGAATALVLHSGRGYRALSRVGEPAPFAVLSLALVVIQFATPLILPLHDLYVAYALLIALVLVGVVVSTLRSADLLRTGWLRYLGQISYVFYLVHNFALNLVEAVVPGSSSSAGRSLVSTTVALALTIVVSGAIHHWFEEPLRRYGARLAKREGSRVRPAEALPTISPEESGR